jgi:hypothetical protein
VKRKARRVMEAARELMEELGGDQDDEDEGRDP